MTTSLAQQLKKLQTPQSQVYQDYKKRVSLLFDPKEAASIDRETFFEIGLSGLRELKSINAYFAVFENTLFSVASKEFERSVQSKDANHILNTNIRSFLLKLSPYFLLRPAHKALEWLIHRFHIHAYNKNDIFSLILPYHETKIFVRFLQIMRLKDDTDYWNWLKPLQKAGIPLTKIVLYNHCVSNVSLLKFISDTVEDAIKETDDNCSTLTTLYAFYCSTVIGTLENVKTITEPIVTSILPMLIHNLHTPISDLRAAAFMITAQLVSKTQLKPKTLKHLVNKILLINKDLSYEAIMLVMIIFESQEKPIKISEKVYDNLVPEDVQILCLNLELLIQNGIDVSKFLLAFTKGVLILITRDMENFMRFKEHLEDIISKVRFDSITVEKLIRCVIRLYTNVKENDTKSESDVEIIDDDNLNCHLELNPAIEVWYPNFLKTLEQKYPSEFDSVIKQFKSNLSHKKRNYFMKKILGIVPIVMQKMGSLHLFEKLYHINIDIRKEAVEYLVSNFDKIYKENENLLCEAVLDRLEDENPQIVSTILSLDSTKLFNIVSNDAMYSKINVILNKGQLDEKFWNTACKAIDILIAQDFQNLNNQILFSMLPYIFPTNKNSCDVAVIILKSQLGKTLLNQDLPNIKKTNKPEKMCKNIYYLFRTRNHFQSWNLAAVLELVDDNNYISIFFCLILLSSNTIKFNNNERIEILNRIMKIFKEVEIIAFDEKTIFQENSIITMLKMTKEKKFPIEVLIFFLQEQICNARLATFSKSFIDFNDVMDVSNKFIITNFEILLNSRFKKYCKFYSSVMKTLLDTICKNRENKIEFIANLIIGYNNITTKDSLEESSVVLLRLIRIFDHALCITDDVSFVFDSRAIITVLIVSLHSEEYIIRNLIINTLTEIINKNSSAHFNYVFLREIVSRKEEILIDHNQLPIIINSLLSQETSVRKTLDKSLHSPMKNTLNFVLNIIIEEETPSHVKYELLKLLNYVNSSDILCSLAPLGLDILKESKNGTVDCYKTNIIINIINRIIYSTFSVKNAPLWKFIETSLDINLKLFDEDKLTLYPSVMMMKQLNIQLFNQFSIEQSQLVLSAIIYAGTFGNEPSITSAFSRVMKRIELQASYLLPILNNMLKSSNVPEKSKKISIPPITVLDTIQWKQGVILLECIQDKEAIDDFNLLLNPLFHILRYCLCFEEQSAVEYVKQLLLSCILHCCKKIYPFENEKNKERVRKAVDIELIILCIRGTQNPQTHHHTLMLLPQIASMFPNEVLHHMMAMFTFIGSSVLRHDDAYSFQIITKIIETVIPILVKFKNQQNEELALEPHVVPVLRIFVDAVLDIPEHRKFILFKKLLVTLNEKHFLWMFLSLMFESFIVHGALGNKMKKDERKLGDIETTAGKLDFAMSITLDFGADVILENCNKLVMYLKTLPEEKPENEESNELSDPAIIFHVPSHTAKHLRHFKYTIITFLNNILSSELFLENVHKFENRTTMEDIFKTFIVTTLTLIQKISKTADNNNGKPQAKYWKVMLHHCYEMLDNINNLLPPEMFITVIRGLMKHHLISVKRKAMEILNSKLQNHTFFESCDKNVMFNLVDPLLDTIKNIESSSNKQEIELNQQTALLSLKLLTRLLCQENPEKFKTILIIITDLTKSTLLNKNLMASVVLCLAELCSNLKAHSIGLMPKFMPNLIKILKSQIEADTPELVLLSVITAIYKIVDTIPLFLSPYLEKLLYQLSILSAKWQKSNKNASSLNTKLNMISNKISSTITPRILIPIINQCYNELLRKGKFDAIGPAMNILANSFTGVSGPEFTSLQQDLTSFFLSALQLRSDYIHNNVVIPAQLYDIEKHVIKALVALVLKLSESSFRPLYYKIYDWSTRYTTDDHKYRSITFYRLSSYIAENLRGLFILFVGHFIKNACDLLVACNKEKTEQLYFDDEDDCCVLVEFILKTFNSIFTYDSQNFINKERFETIMQPLVDQLDNTIGGIESVTSRGKSLIIPCIAQFAIATADDSLWKPLNYQILLKTRHNDSTIRLLGLECMCEMATKLGDSWLPLLPESVPFLAELLEDDVPAVESATQKTIQTLESVLGEPLQKYF